MGFASMGSNKASLLQFCVEAMLVAIAIVALTMVLAAAEVYVTNGHILADAELANGSSIGGITMVLNYSK